MAVPSIYNLISIYTPRLAGASSGLRREKERYVTRDIRCPALAPSNRRFGFTQSWERSNRTIFRYFLFLLLSLRYARLCALINGLFATPLRRSSSGSPRPRSICCSIASPFLTFKHPRGYSLGTHDECNAMDIFSP